MGCALGPGGGGGENSGKIPNYPVDNYAGIAYIISVECETQPRTQRGRTMNATTTLLDQINALTSDSDPIDLEGYRIERRANGELATYRVVTHASGARDSHLLGRDPSAGAALARVRNHQGA